VYKRPYQGGRKNPVLERYFVIANGPFLKAAVPSGVVSMFKKVS
jgi:hypothetical protein